MKISPEKEKPLPQRKQIRLTGYDYSLPGYYYVTVCTQKRKNILGKIVNGEMKLNKIGRMINQCWQKLPEKFTNVSLDEYIIMPNHLHGIVVINDVGAPLVGARSIRAGINPAPTKNDETLGEIIGAFKSLTTNQYIRQVKNNHWPSFNKRLWQRGFYEHIIRNEEELAKIQEYIGLNPLMWLKDENNLEENPA
jgi:REP element-mobilizing transposase RayT